MSLRTQLDSLLRPQPLERFVDQIITIKIFRGKSLNEASTVTLAAVPAWFTLYEMKIVLWNHFDREAAYTPSLVFLGIPLGSDETNEEYKPLEIVWRNLMESNDSKVLYLPNPARMLSGPPDSRFVDSTGAQKAMGRDNRIRMTLIDVFRLNEGHKIPELHAFLYADIIDQIPGLRPLSERDIYGRIVPYFPFLDVGALPSSTGIGAVVTSVLEAQAKQTALSLDQLKGLEKLLAGRTLPSLDGVKLLRWVWNPINSDEWEGAAVFFFGVKVTHERPFLRYFPASGQPLTKIKVKGSRLLPIPDLPDPSLLISWKNDKPPESGKEAVYMKIRVQNEDSGSVDLPIFSTMIVFQDGTAELRIQPPKRARILDPLSDLQDAPEVLEQSIADMVFAGITPSLDKMSVVCKMRLKREDTKVTKAVMKARLGAFSSVFQEIPPLPDESPLAMLRYKGVSNFTNETRIFTYLTLLSERDMNSGEVTEESWEMSVAREFNISSDEAKKQVEAWKYQRGEFALAVSDTKDYILNKNPGVDIAIFEQHPVYIIHIYSDQDIATHRTILSFLSILLSTKPEEIAGLTVKPLATTVAPVVPPSGGATQISLTEPEAEEEEEEFKFEDDEVPEFMRQTVSEDAATANNKPEEDKEEEEFKFEDDEVPEFMRQTVSEDAIEPTATQRQTATVAPETIAQTVVLPPLTTVEEDKEAAKAFGKPADIAAIQVSKYYIERLKLADRKIFNFEKDKADRSYVSYCAANESRQPVVLDNNEYDEMMKIYAKDANEETGDLDFVLYPDQADKAAKLGSKIGQPTEKEDAEGTLGGQPYPTNTNKEIISLVRYGSNKNRQHYFFCPRLFCIRDRLMVRYKDFKSPKNRFKLDAEGNPTDKAPESCPFCPGTLITKNEMKDVGRNPNHTILERKLRPGSEYQRNLFISFLDRKTPNPPHYSLPCCFAKLDNTFKADDPEFVRLGFREPLAQATALATATAQPMAQPVADAIMGQDVGKALTKKTAQVKFNLPEGSVNAPPAVVSTVAPPPSGSKTVKYSYFSVIQGVSVKSIVDSSRTPLKIVEPKGDDDPKAGPQIGFLSEALDTFFNQDSTSEKFAERIEITSKLKPSAQGFLRLAIDNSNKAESFISAIAPFLGYLPNAESVMDTIFGDIEARIPPKKFMQINGGNLVHEFFDTCNKVNTNEMRFFARKYLGITELKSSNIPAIERLMNSYECFKDYMKNPTRRKDIRVFFDILSEPGIMGSRGIIFIVIEMTVEEISIKRDDNKIEFKTEVKFKNIRCPKYPLNEGQQKADVGFLVHYNRISRDRYSQEVTYTDMGWDLLFYVDGTKGNPKSRHKPTLFFQRTLENTEWPAIVQKRTFEFFNKCMTVNRGPFTSEFGIDPYSLISARELMTAVRVQPKGIIRDAYNHLVGIAYKIGGKNGGIVAVPVADDGTVIYEGDIYLDWDDFDAALISNIIEFYNRNIVPVFPQYRGYVPKSQVLHTYLKGFAGVRLGNGFVIPASNTSQQSEETKAYPIEEEPINNFDWDMNNTIAYDAELRRTAFRKADVGREESGDEEVKDPKDKEYLNLDFESSKDEIEDVYQHLRLTFSSWLASSNAGSSKRARLEEILENTISPLAYKRKEITNLLYQDINGWLEPKDDSIRSDIGFLRVDCQIQAEADCKGRCKWAPKDTDNENCGPCKIHTPRKDGVIMDVPRLLYLRLIDELIRYAAKRREIFDRQVPRLTIRKEAQLYGDQYIIPEGSSDWNTWWEKLRMEWIEPEKRGDRHFDEQYNAIPRDLPTTDTRIMPEALRQELGATDPKVDELVWNPSTTPDRPFSFLRSILRFNPIATKTEDTLDKADLDTIKDLGNVQILYMPNGRMLGSLRAKKSGAMEALIISRVDGVVGWVSQKSVYNVRIPIQALPDTLNSFRLV
jgi:hypothetical protein